MNERELQNYPRSERLLLKWYYRRRAQIKLAYLPGMARDVRESELLNQFYRAHHALCTRRGR